MSNDLIARLREDARRVENPHLYETQSLELYAADALESKEQEFQIALELVKTWRATSEAQAREIERLRERLEEATDLLGFAEARLLAFGQHNSTNPDYVLAMDAMKLFLLTADAAMEGGA
jgi:hypothetical protein